MANKRSTTVDKLPKGKLDDNAVVYKVMAALVLLCGGLMVLRSLRSYYATVGAKVTVVEMLDHIAGPTDREISAMLQKELEKKGLLIVEMDEAHTMLLRIC